jgi:hypothetical protein
MEVASSAWEGVSAKLEWMRAQVVASSAVHTVLLLLVVAAILVWYLSSGRHSIIPVSTERYQLFLENMKQWSWQRESGSIFSRSSSIFRNSPASSTRKPPSAPLLAGSTMGSNPGTKSQEDGNGGNSSPYTNMSARGSFLDFRAKSTGRKTEDEAGDDELRALLDRLDTSTEDVNRELLQSSRDYSTIALTHF